MFTNALVVPNLEKIVFTGKPRQYRSDCQKGQFKIGASQLVGDSLDLEVLAWRIFEDEIFGYSYQPWLEVIFVDPKNVVSTILFKTESLDNFANLSLDLAQQGSCVGEGVTTAKMAKRASAANGTTYYAVEFNWQKGSAERLVELAEFASNFQPDRHSLQEAN